MTDIRARILQAMGNMRPADLARLTGISTPSISRYFNDRDPSLDFVMKVCEALKINAHWLLFGTGEMEVDKVDLSTVCFDDISTEYCKRIRDINNNVTNLMKNFEGGISEK